MQQSASGTLKKTSKNKSPPNPPILRRKEKQTARQTVSGRVSEEKHPFLTCCAKDGHRLCYHHVHACTRVPPSTSGREKLPAAGRRSPASPLCHVALSLPATPYFFFSSRCSPFPFAPSSLCPPHRSTNPLFLHKAPRKQASVMASSLSPVVCQGRVPTLGKSVARGRAATLMMVMIRMTMRMKSV